MPETLTRKPVCPACGSHDCEQVDLVAVPHKIESIEPDGQLEVESDDGLTPEYESGIYHGVRCADCDHESTNAQDFYPWANERERARAMIGERVRDLDDGGTWRVASIEQRCGQRRDARAGHELDPEHPERCLICKRPIESGWWLLSETYSDGVPVVAAKPTEVRMLP